MSDLTKYIKNLEQWLDSQSLELRNEIEEIEKSDDPDLLTEPMTECELLEMKAEVYEEVAGMLLTIKAAME